MRNVTRWNWLTAVSTALVLLLGCGEDCKCGVDAGSGGGSGTDTSHDNDTATRGTVPEDVALISFCNPLAYGTEDAVMHLFVGEGDDQVVLSASTQTCSNRLGDPCQEIPPGTAVSLVVQNDSGVEQFSMTLDIEPATVYMVSTNVDADANIILDHGTLSENFDCSNMECNTRSYNDRTCVADDPCGWAGNANCDDFCLEKVTTMFDDSADCS